MATFNREKYILESLLSIQNQTFTNWECLIIDDGGTDNTKNSIEDLLEKDARFQYFKRTNNYLKGLPGSRNYGLDLAKGEYIIFFDDDDIVHPQNLEICSRELKSEAIDFCRYERTVFFDDFDYNFDLKREYKSFSIDKSHLERIIKNTLPINSCAIMWKKKCFYQNRFIETLMYAEEWELYTRIISNNFKGISIDKTLFFGRKHNNSNTGEFFQNNPIRIESKVEAIILIAKNFGDKSLLTNSLKKYFVILSHDYQEYNFFNELIKNFKINDLEKLKWRIFYFFLPVRIFLYRIKSKLLKS